MTDKPSLEKILIVKTSSIGDIIQAFSVLDYLNHFYPKAEIDWLVEKPCQALVSTHPLISSAICMDTNSWKKRPFSHLIRKEFFQFCKNLRKKNYDIVFDIQGNCKSAVATLLSKGKVKVGFGRKSVREWPNLMATDIRFNVPKNINMRLQYLQLLQNYFKDPNPVHLRGVRLKIPVSEKDKLEKILNHPSLATKMRVMICPGSKWANKKLGERQLGQFLKLLEKRFDASYLLLWGNEREKAYCEQLQKFFQTRSVIVDKLPLPVWQNLMNDVDLVIAVDSSALHLCGTTSTPSFSVFGPTSPQIFKPIGKKHYAYLGKCPFKKEFPKQCPLLRTCPSGGCIQNIKPEDLFKSFINWWQTLSYE